MKLAIIAIIILVASGMFWEVVNDVTDIASTFLIMILVFIGVWYGIKKLADVLSDAQMKTLLLVMLGIFILQILLASALNPATFGFNREWIMEGQRGDNFFSTTMRRLIITPCAWILWWVFCPFMGYHIWNKQQGGA